MTYLPPRLDRLAGTAARRLLAWAGGRSAVSDRPWIRVLRAEVDELGTGLDQLAWAVEVLPLVLAERVAALLRRWRPRLVWLASGGGLGGLRVYGPAVVSGMVMLAWMYGHRAHLESGAPLLAALRLLPYYLVFYTGRGLLTARRRSDDAAAAVAAATAVVGYLVVVAGASAYIGATVPGAVWVVLPITSLLLVFVVAATGAACGVLGAALGHPATTIRFIRSRYR